MDDKSTVLRTKLYRCLEIAMRNKDLECHVNNIVPYLSHCIEDGRWYSATVDVWCSYFISKNGDKAAFDGVYPLTVVADRYSGTYSGGKWTAWNLYPWEVPDGTFGDDCGCFDFWQSDCEEYCIGIGNTPEEAICDLKTKMDLKE